ncbi:PAS domain S-box protein [Methanosarcina sp.]|uniref:PAS domain S-box protein n=1 Tax=Methanosarcina sp. TaxID=2213 RepID=UPI003C745B90
MKTKMEQFPAKNPNPVLRVEKDGTVLYSNVAGEPLLHEWGVGIGEKLPSFIGDFVQKVISRNSPEKMEVKVGKRVYLVALHPLPDEEFVNIYGFDISDQKELEGKLRESEEKYRNIVETANEGIWVIDAEATTTYVNEKMAEMLGYSQEEMIGRLVWDFTDERGKAILKLNIEKRLEKRRQGIDESHELKLIRKDGSSLWVLVNSKYLFNKDGKFTGSLSMLTDITERKRTEEKLKQSEKQYWTLGDTIPYGVWLTDAAGYCTYVSASFLELVDMSMEQVQKFGWLHLLPPEDVQPTIDHWLRCIQTGEEFEREHRFRAKDGSYRNLLAIGRPIKNEEGEITGWVGLNLNITERKQVEEALTKSENEFRTLAENSPDVIARFDRQNRHMYANPAAAESYGRSQEEILGKTHTELGRNPEQVRFWEGHYENVFTTGKPETMEFQYTSPQGKKYYFNTQIVPEFVDGKVISVLAISRDIIDIKKAEAKLKKTLENLENLVKGRTAELEKAYKSLKESEKRLAEAQKMAHLGNWDWNIVTDEVHWSDELYRIFGRNPQELDPTYQEFLSYVHPGDRDYVSSATNIAMNGKPYSIDYRIISTDGAERVVHEQGEVIFDKKNIPARMRGIVQDITERKKAEEALEKMEKIRIKEIHHRIKNNLQVISSLLDLQAETFSHLETCKTPEVVEAFIESQNRVISMALIHEELYKGDKIDTLDFAAYLRKLTVDLFGSYNPGNKDIGFKLDLKQVYLGMDTAIPLGIIVNELVSNAFKHAFPARREGEIRINLRRVEASSFESEIIGQDKACTEENGFDYRLEVSDNGKGIREEIDFENTDSLGLQLVNILVQQIDGCIKLERDHGAKFIIWFNNMQT